MGFNSLPILGIILVYPRSSVAIKNGNKEGITLLAHNKSPRFSSYQILPRKNY